MKRLSLVEFSVEHPKLIVVLSVVITLLFMTQFPKMKTDTNPKHMLPETSDVRVWNDEVDKIFGLYEDMIVVGIKNEKGIVNTNTLSKIKNITDEIMRIKGVASRDVNSFPTITNIETMRAVGRPVRYTALATAGGFAVLLFVSIIPVKVFGGVIAFGTMALRVLSFSFIPAMFTFVKEYHLDGAAKGEDIDAGKGSRFLRGLAGLGVYKSKATVITGIILFVIAIIGISKIVVNNNMVEWFKKNSEVRYQPLKINFLKYYFKILLNAL